MRINNLHVWGIATLIVSAVSFSSPAFAASYTASDLLGQLNASNTPVYTTAFTQNTRTPNNVGFLAPRGVALDTVDHRLFVSDTSNNRVLIFNLDSNNNLIDRVADNVLGQTNFTNNSSGLTRNTLNLGTTVGGLAYDSLHKRLFVADGGNKRALVFNADPSVLTDGENADYVLGEPNFTTSSAVTTQSGVSSVTGLAYDATNDRLFVADPGNFSVFNERVLVYNVATSTIANGENASYVIGQFNFTTTTATALGSTTQTGLTTPQGLAYDSDNNRLFVAQTSTARVTVYDVSTSTMSNGKAASYVLGQTSFTASSNVVTATGLSSAYSPTYDAVSKRLFVADLGGNRVVVYNVATSTITNGESADYVIGQSSFTASASGTTASTSNAIYNVVYDSSNNRLYAADSGNARVLVYNVATSTMANGMLAIDSLGHLDASSNPVYTVSSANNASAKETGFSAPQYDVIDPVGHRLFVSDTSNNRVLIFNLDSNNNLIDRVADNVLGQTSLFLSSSATTQSGMSSPSGLAYDSANSRLFVANAGNHRVLVFNVATSTFSDGENASFVLGQSSFTAGSSATTQSGMNAPAGLAYDPLNQLLYVAEPSNNRVTVWNASTTSIASGENASYVLGQADFVSNSSATTQSLMSSPQSVLYDATSTRLFVSDGVNNRVLVFNTSSISNGMNASNVIGQSSFTTRGSPLSQSGLSTPSGLALDFWNNRLFVADGGNKRILSFNVATSTMANGMAAEAVFGQPDFTTNTSATTNANLNLGTNSGLDFDQTNRRLYSVDTTNNRLMIFNLAKIATAGVANGAVGSAYSQNISASNTQGTVSVASTSGSLPSGLSFSGASIVGTPTTAGSYSFTIRASDAGNPWTTLSDQVQYLMNIATVTPSVSASDPSATSQTSATLVGSIDSLGGDSVTTRGFTYGLYTDSDQTTSVSGSFSQGSYSANLSSLFCNSIYRFKAFATNSAGTAYSPTRTFLTSSCPGQSGSSGGGSVSSSGGYSSYLAPVVAPVVASVQPSPAAVSNAVFLRPIALGDSGLDVKRLQDLLRTEGFFTASSTGYFGLLTARAVSSYQKAHSISPIGKVGPLTLSSLNAAPAEASITEALTSDLSKGDQGEDVRKLQTMLVSLGLLSAEPNGYFGPQTLKAVLKYQASQGISQTGVVGPATWKSLTGKK
jgi:peptidoglycan hydrolase-like protein with peptidoglycan-binding domain/DNA-binding beta-propeller fold protein YncE